MADAAMRSQIRNSTPEIAVIAKWSYASVEYTKASKMQDPLYDSETSDLFLHDDYGAVRTSTRTRQIAARSDF
jgi:hypothetical protein